MTKQDQGNAERAAEHYCVHILGCVETHRTVRNRFQKIDFFGADVMGKLDDGSKVFAQVTTGGYEAQRQRKRKLDRRIWHESDMVLLMVMQRKKEGRVFRYWFSVHELSESDWQEMMTPVTIPREWFKALKRETVA